MDEVEHHEAANVVRPALEALPYHRIRSIDRGSIDGLVAALLSSAQSTVLRVWPAGRLIATRTSESRRATARFGATVLTSMVAPPRPRAVTITDTARSGVPSQFPEVSRRAGGNHLYVVEGQPLGDRQRCGASHGDVHEQQRTPLRHRESQHPTAIAEECDPGCARRIGRTVENATVLAERTRPVRTSHVACAAAVHRDRDTTTKRSGIERGLQTLLGAPHVRGVMSDRRGEHRPDLGQLGSQAHSHPRLRPVL